MSTQIQSTNAVNVSQAHILFANTKRSQQHKPLVNKYKLFWRHQTGSLGMASITMQWFRQIDGQMDEQMQHVRMQRGNLSRVFPPVPLFGQASTTGSSVATEQLTTFHGPARTFNVKHNGLTLPPLYTTMAPKIFSSHPQHFRKATHIKWIIDSVQCIYETVQAEYAM